MSSIGSSTVEVGDDTTPIALAASQTATWTHNQGKKAIKVEALNAGSRGVVQHDEAGTVAAAAQTVKISQPDANTITVLNLDNAGAKNVIIRATFEDPSIAKADTLPASSVVVA